MGNTCLTRRQAIATITSSVLGSCAGCTTPNSDRITAVPTTQFRAGIQNRGYVDQTIPSSVEVEWAVPTNRGDHTASKGSPVKTSNGALLIADDTGRVRSLNSDGSINWATTITDAKRGSHGTPAIDSKTAYIGAYDGTVTALDETTGDVRWQTTVGDAVGASPTYYDDRLYVAVEHATPSGSIVALDTNTGDIVWRDDRPTDHPHSTVSIDRNNNRLLFGSNDGHCYAWSFPGLQRKWTYDTGGAIKAPIAISNGVAIVPSWAETITGIDVTDGSRLWEFKANDDVMCAPAVHDKTVYIGSHDKTLYALDLTTGDLAWTTETDGWITGSAVATNNHVLVGSYDAKLYAINKNNGSITWAVTNRGEVTSAPLVTENAIYYTERAAEGDPTQPGMCYKLVASSME